MSKRYWIIDAGHGGLKQGKYVTAPNKMFHFNDGLVIYEGVVNRDIAKILCAKLHDACIDFAIVYDDVEDWGLGTRAALVNKIYNKNKNAISLSIHSNAGGGNGFEYFTSHGETEADLMGEVLYQCYRKFLPKFEVRVDKTDGDHDKEARFTMVGYESNGKWVGPKCPALLVENLFFDNRKEAEYLLSDEGKNEIANCLFEWIKLIEKDEHKK